MYMLCIYIDNMSIFAYWDRIMVPPPEVVCLRCLRCSRHILDMVKFYVFRLYIYMKYAYFLEILAISTPELAISTPKWLKLTISFCGNSNICLFRGRNSLFRGRNVQILA